MKANELRIGNYIEIGGKITQVGEIFDSGITTELDKHQYEYVFSYINPVLLTEEWLTEKSMFTTKGNILFEIKKHPDFALRAWKLRQPIEWFVFWGQQRLSLVKLEYVHQLQNIYFALTGEELEFNLND